MQDVVTDAMERKLRRGRVKWNGVLAGILEETADGFRFLYDLAYLQSPASQAISLTLPKSPDPYLSSTLFPFFYGLLAEGTTRQMQCRRLKVDDTDYFGLLLKTAHSDVIGAVTVEEEGSS